MYVVYDCDSSDISLRMPKRPWTRKSGGSADDNSGEGSTQAKKEKCSSAGGGHCKRCEIILKENTVEDGLDVVCLSLDPESSVFEDELQNICDKYKNGNVCLLFHLSDMKKVKYVEAMATKALANDLKFDVKCDDTNAALLIKIACFSCQKTVQDVEDNDAEIVFVMHMDIVVVNGEANVSKDKERKCQMRAIRKSYTSDFIRKVSTLRNSGGGIIIVHLTGREPDDFYVGSFDEMVAESLQRLLNPGELFVDEFLRERFMVDEDLLVRFRVGKSSQFSTGDFKTKLPLDDRLIDPESNVILNILSSRRRVTGGRSMSDDAITAKDPNYHEDRHLQLKRFKEGIQKDSMSVGDITDIIWNDLKLGENITAFSKVVNGGVYMCGIAEEDEYLNRYKTIKTKEYGIPLLGKKKKELEEALKNKIKKEMTAINTTFEEDKIYHRGIYVSTKELGKDHCILKVKVRHFPGLVFYDPNGPASYRYDDNTNTIRRLDLKEWLSCFKEKCLVRKETVATQTEVHQ